MSNLVSFPANNNVDRLAGLKERVQNRFGVSLSEYMNRTPETQAKIDRAMQKETMRVASQS
ncbi:hypothetical protein [Paenibacillus taichungensis]|uniref:hypothetical protein n=1 Tax=Paenibacillus taichungensis TaxID=484184 RepID=UPI0035DEEC05